jgi:hypothetical protein
MAVIEVVFNYDDNTGKVSREIHVVSMDDHDQIRFVTYTPGLTLKAEVDVPFLDLSAGDLAPVKYTTVIRQTQGVPEFPVYYHGTIAKFACGELDNRNTFQNWPHGVGQPSPGGGSP